MPNGGVSEDDFSKGRELETPRSAARAVQLCAWDLERSRRCGWLP